MKAARTWKSAFTLIELLVVISIIALLVAILLPSLNRAREQSRRAKCGSNLKTIGTAYQLWANTNKGFLPPRCRADIGCRERDVIAEWKGATPVRMKFHYGCSPSNGFGVAGQPTFKPGATDPYDPDSYNGPNNYPLNPYLIPNWKLGTPMELTHCPSDVRTLTAPDNDVAGIPEGGVASCFDLHGTSYATNILWAAPWRGHGPWARLIEGPRKSNRKTGPNFVPDRIFAASRYVVSVDLANFYENWSFLIRNWIGGKSDTGRWHQAKAGDPWELANASFLDGHVALDKYEFPYVGIIGFSSLQGYVTAKWSLYPLKYEPMFMKGGS